MFQPFSFYRQNAGLKLFLIKCGHGLTTLIIFPNNYVMLFDCNLQEESDYNNKDEILSFFDKVIPKRIKKDGSSYQPIDLFVNSHRDLDHIRGLKSINERFPISAIWDSGCEGTNTDNDEYVYYTELLSKLKKQNPNNVEIPIPSSSIYKTIDGVNMYCLNSSKHNLEDTCSDDESLEQHRKSIVLLLSYANRKVLLTGDSDFYIWNKYITQKYSDIYKNSTLLVASHHGSRSFFSSSEDDCIDENYLRFVGLISPVVTLISCADYNYKDYHLPNKEALEIYQSITSNKQVYSTHEHGTFFCRIDSSGNFSVTPESFISTKFLRDKRFEIVCTTKDGLHINSGDEVSINNKLYFSLKGYGQVLNINDHPTVVWQVCNSGEGEDCTHHEIYFKNKNENGKLTEFERDLSYKGTHLLRCTVNNTKKSFKQTVVFVVHGV